MSPASSPSGVSAFPRSPGSSSRSRTGRTYHSGQLRHAQASQGKKLVCYPSSLPAPLHPHWFVVAKSNRTRFAEITAKRIRRGTFRSVKELIAAIEGYIRENNNNPKPFVWTATPKSILKKLRKYKDILDTAH